MKRRKQGYEGTLSSVPFFPCLSQEKVRSCSWRTSFETMSGTSLPSRPRMSPPSFVPTVYSFFPRVPRDAFGAPCLVIRVMYDTLIALRRIATELRRNRSHNYSRTLAYGNQNLLGKLFHKSCLIWTFIIIEANWQLGISFLVRIYREKERDRIYVTKMIFWVKMLPSINCRECWHSPPLWFRFCVRQRDSPLSALALLP